VSWSMDFFGFFFPFGQGEGWEHGAARTNFDALGSGNNMVASDAAQLSRFTL